MVAYLLKQTGLEFTIVENGKDALEAVREQSFQLILMDMQMPVLDGYSATKELRRQGYKMPIVGLTAHSFEKHREKCFAAGCTDYLGKPFERDAFFALLSDYFPADDSPSTVIREESLFDDDPEFLTIRTEFVESLANHISDLRKAAAADDSERIGWIAHTLRSASMLGLGNIGDAAASVMENLANDDKNSIRSVTENLATEMERELYLYRARS